MKNEFIPYEEALAFKELGFDEKCYGYYTEYKDYFYFDVDDLSSAYTKNMDNLIVNSVDDLECTAPLYQQAFRWFREKYGLDGESTRYNLNNRESKILGVDVKHIYLTMINGVARDWEDIELKDATYYTTYEEAELACLRKLIEIVNQNKDDE